MKAYIFVLAVLVSSCSLWESGEEEEIPTIPGKLVFSALDESEHYQIYTSLTNGAKLKKLTNFKNDDVFSPSWSNDGKQIAFSTSLNATTSGSSLYLMNADGSNLRPLKKRPNTTVPTAGNNPAWSPDDSKIAFDFCTNCERGGNNFEIYTYDFETDSIKKITQFLGSDKNPEWENEGTYLAFDSDRASNSKLVSDVYMINLQTDSLIRLTETNSAGRQLFFNLKDEMIFWSNDSLYSLELKQKNVKKSIPVNLATDIGFRPLQISQDDKYVLLHTFNYKSPNDSQTLSVLNVLTAEIESEFKNSPLGGADWYYK